MRFSRHPVRPSPRETSKRGILGTGRGESSRGEEARKSIFPGKAGGLCRGTIDPFHIAPMLRQPVRLGAVHPVGDARSIMLKQTLHAGWTVKAVNDLTEVPPPLRDLAMPATVPGCIHTDLLRAEKIPDPYKDLNEFQTRWIGMTDWEYRTTFEADE